MNLRCLPRESSVGLDGCNHEVSSAELPLVEQLEPAGPEHVEAICAEILAPIAREAAGVQRRRVAGISTVGRSRSAEELNPAVGLSPGLGRVVDGSRGRPVRVDVLRVPRVGM